MDATKQRQLTREEILALPAGPELDELVTRRIMTLVWNGTGYSLYCEITGITTDYIAAEALRPFSTDITAAWQVVATLDDRSHSLSLRRYSGKRTWLASFTAVKRPLAEAEADTVPLALCRAALLAVLESR